MGASRKLIRTAMNRRILNPARPYQLSVPAQVSLSTGLNVPSANRLYQKIYRPTERFMSSATTSMEPDGVDLSLDKLSSSIAGGDYVRLLVKDNPYIDVVQYTHKNVIYNISHVDYHSEALAIGITENGLIPGDVVLTFLPPHLCESVRCVTIDIACSYISAQAKIKFPLQY